MTERSLVAELEARVRARPLPRHVAIIMDGNGRWAEARELPRVAGHREGAEAVRAVTRAARRIGIPALTLYAFSTENWGRPEPEVDALMHLLAEFLESERGEMMANGIRLNAIGDLSRLPAAVREKLASVQAETAGNRGMILTLALSYGGRQELVQAARRAAAAKSSASRKSGQSTSVKTSSAYAHCQRRKFEIRRSPLVRTSRSSSGSPAVQSAASRSSASSAAPFAAAARRAAWTIAWRPP